MLISAFIIRKKVGYNQIGRGNYDKKINFDSKRNIYNLNICWSRIYSP